MTATYDLIVIGAGIHGAGIAQAAAARGWSVLVVDKGEPASGTSSKSSKLIHGGLRYLETLQIKLVYECLRERATLLRNAPDLVQLRSFYIPVYRHSRRSPFWIRLGLSLYAVLGGLGRDARFASVPKKDWDKLNGLNTRDLQHVYRYQDAQTDDAALTRAVLESAKSLGAALWTHAPVRQVVKEGEAYRVSVGTAEEGDHRELQCRAVVNAAGPWVNHVADVVSPPVEQLPIELVQGSHIILSFEAPKGCFYLESPDDGRAVFTLPWKGKTMVGTTETRCESAPDQCRPFDEEVAYLLRVFNTYFPGLNASENDIADVTAGLRVLPKAQSDSVIANKLPRDTQYVVEGRSPLYLAVYGGKLTSYRATSERVINKLEPYLPRKERVAETDELRLV